MNFFKDTYKMGKEHVFSGLNRSAIKFLRQEGMWMPINYEILELDSNLINKKELIYTSYKNCDFLMFILIENGEFLLGKVYNLIHLKKQMPLMLHEYILVDGTTIIEEEQITINGEVFLYLVEQKSKGVISEWSTKEIEEYLN